MKEVPQNGLMQGSDGCVKCWWCCGEPLYEQYHDEEWGRPLKDDRLLFEKVCLEGFQAGLSWLTILKKRDNFRKVFKNFDYKKIVKFTKHDVNKILKDRGVVRHRGKIESVISNAKRAIELEREFGSLATFFWQHEPEDRELPKELNWDMLLTMTKTGQSVNLSKRLKKRGWSYVGPTTMYAFMQSVGIVNDHIEGCVCREKVEIERNKFERP